MDTPDAGEQPPTLTPEPTSAPPWPHRDPAGPATASAVAPVLEAIRELSAAMDHYRHAFGTAHELGTAEITALTHLLTVEQTTAGRLAARTNLTPGSVTALMDRLERRGYLTRPRPPPTPPPRRNEHTHTRRPRPPPMYTPLLPLLETAAADPKAPDPGRMAHCLDQIAELIDHLASTPPTT